MIINITQDDINHGERQNCKSCPGARAINRVLLYPLCVYVNATHIHIIDYDTIMMTLFTIPYVLSNFIYRFDERLSVEPCSFELDISEYLVKREYVLRNKKELSEEEKEEFYNIIFWRPEL